MELALTLGAVAIATVVLLWLLSVVRSTFKAAILVALFLLGLYIAFGIGPSTVWETIRGWFPGSVQSNGG